MAKDFSVPNTKSLIEKILGGDARSVTLREGLPNFTEEL